MPHYDYQCTDCGAIDTRVAAVDDQFAVCASCGGRMIRQSNEPLEAYHQDDQDGRIKAPDFIFRLHFGCHPYKL